MDKDNKRIGLALSGGGYRAAAYHIGTLRALHKLGILENVDVISSLFPQHYNLMFFINT